MQEMHKARIELRWHTECSKMYDHEIMVTNDKFKLLRVSLKMHLKTSLSKWYQWRIYFIVYEINLREIIFPIFSFNWFDCLKILGCFGL